MMMMMQRMMMMMIYCSADDSFAITHVFYLSISDRSPDEGVLDQIR